MATPMRLCLSVRGISITGVVAVLVQLVWVKQHFESCNKGHIPLSIKIIYYALLYVIV